MNSKNKNIDVVVEDFINYLQYIKRMSIHTAINYKSDLKQFFNFHFNINEYDRNKLAISNICNIRRNDIRYFIVSLKENELDNRTINRKVYAIRSFFNYLLRRKSTSLQGNEIDIKLNPCATLKPLRTKKRIPKTIPQGMLLECYSQMDFDYNFIKKSYKESKKVIDKNYLEQCRNYIIVDLLYYCGLRISELSHIRICDINFNANEIKVTGKGNKERFIFLNESLKNNIWEFTTDFWTYYNQKYNIELSDKRIIHAHQDYYLINSLVHEVEKKALYSKAIYNIVVNQFEKYGIRYMNPHSLRHCFATHLLDNGADLYAIKTLLGHSNLLPTQIYLSSSIQRLSDVYNKSRPQREYAKQNINTILRKARSKTPGLQ